MNQPDKTPRKNFYFMLFPILTAIIIIVVSVLLYFSLYAATAEERMKYSLALVISGVFAPVALFLLFIYGIDYARTLKILGGDYWVRWEYPKDWGKGDVYFGNTGVYDTDKPYKALDTFGSKFLGAEIPSDDPSIMRFTNLQYTGTNFNKSKRTQDVEIPPGKEEEAQKLVQRFQEHIGSSSKITKDQWRYVFPLLGIILLWAFISFQFVATPAGEEAKKERSQQAKVRADAQLKENINQLTPLWNKIRQTLEPKLEQLKTLPNGKLTPKEAGFDENSEVMAVLYGHCGSKNEFYLSVVLKKIAVTQYSTFYGNETGAFNYTTTKPFPSYQSDRFCKPLVQDDFSWRIFLSDGWLYGEVNNKPYLPKFDPAANSQTNQVKK